MNSSHKRQGSSSSFSVDLNALNIRLSSLENFMFLTKLMQDDILVPTKLKDRTFDLERINTINNATTSTSANSPVAQHNPVKTNNLNDSITESETDELNESMKETENLRLAPSADILDHYRFILLVRSQFMQTNPFINSNEFKYKELETNEHFKAVFDKLKFHYKEMMSILDSLSSEAKLIMEVYKEN